MSCNLPHTWRVSSEFDNCSRIRPMFMANGHLSIWRKRNDNSFRSIFNFVARARPPLSYFSSNSSACRMTERLAFENRPTVAFPFRLPLQTPPLNVISVMCWMGKSVWLGDYSALRPSAMRVLGRASRSIIAFSKSAATAIPAFFYSVQHIVYMYIGWMAPYLKLVVFRFHFFILFFNLLRLLLASFLLGSHPDLLSNVHVYAVGLFIWW